MWGDFVRSIRPRTSNQGPCMHWLTLGLQEGAEEPQFRAQERLGGGASRYRTTTPVDGQPRIREMQSVERGDLRRFSSRTVEISGNHVCGARVGLAQLKATWHCLLSDAEECRRPRDARQTRGQAYELRRQKSITRRAIRRDSSGRELYLLNECDCVIDPVRAEDRPPSESRWHGGPHGA